jgi:hypothetical protein
MHLNKQEINKQTINSLKDEEGFSKAENDLLIEGLKRSHMDRFLFATRLYKMQKTMQKFSISHKPYIINN